MPMSAAAWWAAFDAAGVDDLDARTVPCPTCGAAVGTYCRRPSGHKAMSGAHADRWDDAVRAAQPVAGQPPVDQLDPEYADVDEDGQLALGVAGEQRAIPGLARPREEN